MTVNKNRYFISGAVFKNSSGYTLVELMVTLVLTSLAVIGIYMGYTSIITANEVQEQLVELQQNLRIGTQRLVKDIHLAGYDPKDKAGASILSTSDTDDFDFEMDDDGNGITDTTINYELVGDELRRSADGGVTFDSIISNVVWLDFEYLDGAGNPLATGPIADPSAIRTIQVAIVARTTNEDFTLDTGAETFWNRSGTRSFTTVNFNFHYRLSTAEVKCRNMGLL